MKKVLITLLTFIFCIAPVDISAKENSIILKADCTFIEYGSPVGKTQSFLDTDEMCMTSSCYG